MQVKDYLRTLRMPKKYEPLYRNPENVKFVLRCHVQLQLTKLEEPPIHQE